jgi:hypothetical protein
MKRRAARRQRYQYSATKRSRRNDVARKQKATPNLSFVQLRIRDRAEAPPRSPRYTPRTVKAQYGVSVARAARDGFPSRYESSGGLSPIFVVKGRGRLVLGVLMGLLAIAALRDLSRLDGALPWKTMDEFADFYCAGSVANQHASPYTYEPLHLCEHRVNVGATLRDQIFQKNPAVVFPAPQPPYDFVPFMALARLPRDTTRVIDAVAIVSAAALCAATIADLGVPIAVVAASLILSVVFASLNTAQIVPFALLALVGCGWLLRRNSNALAGIAAAVTAVEPTLGVAAMAATLLYVPKARATLLLTAVALALVAVGVVGEHGVVQYVAGVLPAHAVSEIGFPFQYSLTYALAYAHAPAVVARLGGALSYVVLVALGLYAAPRAAAALDRRELLVFLPALCAVIGGAFVHQEELCFALPALLVLAASSRGRAQFVFAAALCVLAIPWILVWGMKQLFLASMFVCAAIVLRLRVERWSALLIFLVIGVALYLFELHPPHLPEPVAMTRPYPAAALAEAAWRDYTSRRSSSDGLWIAIKIPTWAALVAALAAALSVAPRSPAPQESPRQTN